MKGTLRRVKGFKEIAADCAPLTTNKWDKRLDGTYDTDRDDGISGQWYVQVANGKVYRTNQQKIEKKLFNLPDPVEEAIYEGLEVGVEFETVDKPHGKYLWAKNVEFTNIDKLTEWAAKQK